MGVHPERQRLEDLGSLAPSLASPASATTSLSKLLLPSHPFRKLLSLQRNATPTLPMLRVNLVGKLLSFGYIDPTKENDSLLHTQLWIDPAEELVQYAYNGNPVDVTFAVKELKAFLAFCEGCEVDFHMYFKKA
ncbi:hypothetical protein NL676_020140, partial [Syzygium grande]